ncbi:MAG: polysaccharide biosynthesis C-terminal domain-containing protein, partial [Clostridia bacterium]|nr:polysaccharide biosynthesis C-terminal domain-containing protein [Clostridia bacterium]
SVALKVFSLVGLAGMTIMIVFSKVFSNLYNLPAMYTSVIAIAPTLFFICISSTVRGYFQGYQLMTPTAISEVIESLGKLLIGVALSIIVMHPYMKLFGNETAEADIPVELFPKASSLAVLGLTIGVFISMCYLLVKRFKFNDAEYNAEFVRPDSNRLPVRSDKTILKTLIIIAVPVMISASMMSFANMLDGMIISTRLKSFGLDEVVRAKISGAIKNQVVTFFNMPPALIYPISASLVPYISTLRNTGTRRDMHRVMNSAVKVTSMIALPCALGMSVLSGPIIQLLFNTSENPAEMAYSTATLLSVQALAVFFLALYSITTAFLQAHGYERKPIISVFCGVVVKLLSSFILIGIPGIQILGAPIGTLLCYITITVVNFFFVAKHIRFLPRFGNTFIRPLISAVICAGSALLVYKLLSLISASRIMVIIAIAVAALVYAVCIFVTRTITKEDMLLLPKGQKIYNKLHSMGIMK